MTNFKRISGWSKALAAVAAVGMAGTAKASSHREAPAISNDPAADNTDLWAWVDGTNLVVVASYIPMEEPSGGPNFHKFSDDVLYQIHITDPGVPNGQDGGASYDLNDQLTYQFRFTTASEAPAADTATTPVPGGGVEFFSQLTSYVNQSYTVKVVDGSGNINDLTPAGGLAAAPPNIGPRTNAVAYSLSGTYEDFAESKIGTLTDGTKVFAGPRDDGFYVDLGGVFDLANLRTPTSTFASDGGANPAVDGLAGFNVHTIALAIPLANIHGGATAHAGTAGDDSTVGVWASASRKKVSILRNDGTTSWYGPWTQVSRQGLPLINEAIIGIQDKDKYNRTTPTTDVANFAAYFTIPTIVRDAAAVGDISNPGPGLLGPRTDILLAINLAPTHHIPIAPGATGDVLRVDLATASQFPNGRSLEGGALPNQEPVNVTDVLLSVLLTGGPSGVSTGVPGNDADFLTHFPYLAAPWEGYSQGHGKVPPAN